MAKRGRKPERKRSTTARDLPVSWVKPAHLRGPAETAWRHVVGLLAANGTLGQTDPVLVETYAINVALLRAAQKDIASRGTMVEGRFGSEVNPATAVVNSTTMRIKAIINDLGLCPASSKFSSPTHGETKGSKWDGLLGVIG